MNIFNRHAKAKAKPTKSFSDEDLGIKTTPAEEESVILEKKQERANNEWHKVKSLAARSTLDIYIDEQLRRRGHALT